jgi:hypothetical protein
VASGYCRRIPLERHRASQFALAQANGQSFLACHLLVTGDLEALRRFWVHSNYHPEGTMALVEINRSWGAGQSVE